MPSPKKKSVQEPTPKPHNWHYQVIRQRVIDQLSDMRASHLEWFTDDGWNRLVTEMSEYYSDMSKEDAHESARFDRVVATLRELSRVNPNGLLVVEVLAEDYISDARGAR